MPHLLIADTNSNPVLSTKTWEELEPRKRFVKNKIVIQTVYKG